MFTLKVGASQFSAMLQREPLDHCSAQSLPLPLQIWIWFSAVLTKMTLGIRWERTQALLAFSPHLPYGL